HAGEALESDQPAATEGFVVLVRCDDQRRTAGDAELPAAQRSQAHDHVRVEAADHTAHGEQTTAHEAAAAGVRLPIVHFLPSDSTADGCAIRAAFPRGASTAGRDSLSVSTSISG